MAELPSHFTELYLTEYSFVKQFALIQFVKEASKDSSPEGPPDLLSRNATNI
jgi:hypothetical protein